MLPRTLCPRERSVVETADGRTFHVRRIATISVDEFQRSAWPLLGR